MINLSKMEKKVSRSISPENYTGAKGGGARIPQAEGSAAVAARELGTGWKCNPFIVLRPGETFTIADIGGSGIIEHIWLTPTGKWRETIVRMYWDKQEQPSVECPLGDFFCMGWNEYAPLNSLPVCVNPGSAFNCYWPMPFRRHAQITLTNTAAQEVTMYYQIDYCLCDVAEDELYFHAQFRRVNPLPYKKVYTILDGVKGRGKYVGTYMAWGSNSSGWWGEGEIKFYMDGDEEYPTICTTGTEDYFCGSYNFENQKTRQYEAFSTAYSGLHQVIRPDGVYASQTRFGMYRWHIADPIYFEACLNVTIQALGWRSGHRYLPLQDDIASTAFWYQTLPTAPFPALPDKDALEVI